jgi:oligopeptide/dipeptide ABC transporter ATP-binding protein
MPEEILLNVQNLKTYFYILNARDAVKAVDDVSLRLKKNYAIGLVGESGCGKSTLGLSITRLLHSSGRIVGGNIFFKGKDLLKLSDREMQDLRGKEISMVFQDPMTFLNPIMKIKDQISECLMAHQTREKSEIKNEVIDALTLVQIPSPSEVAEYYPHQLSGGMRQRVLIAMAISSKPSLIIADEPTTALDLTIQAQVLSLMKNLRKEMQTSLMLISHDLGIVCEFCDAIYVMYAGKVFESADVFSLFEEPLHPYTKGLLDSVLSIDEYKENLRGIDGRVPDLRNPPSGCRFHPRCTQVKSICAAKEPPIVHLGHDHFVSCWLY